MVHTHFESFINDHSYSFFSLKGALADFDKPKEDAKGACGNGPDKAAAAEVKLEAASAEKGKDASSKQAINSVS